MGRRGIGESGPAPAVPALRGAGGSRCPVFRAPAQTPRGISAYRKRAAAFAAARFLYAAEAASASAAGSSEVQVGIVLPTKDEPRWLQDHAQFEKILGDASFTNQVIFSQGSSAAEKTNVETLISKSIKVLVICAQDGAAVAPHIRLAPVAVTAENMDDVIIASGFHLREDVYQNTRTEG